MNSTQSSALGSITFCAYYEKWLQIYKQGAVKDVTYNKYVMTLRWLRRLIPDLVIQDLNRLNYQDLLNRYAATHERQTTMDFHHQLKGAILDAVDDGLIDRDPTRKAIIKGKTPRPKKAKFLNQFELHKLLSALNISGPLNWDCLFFSWPRPGCVFLRPWLLRRTTLIFLGRL